MRRFTRVLHRMRSIDAEVEVNLLTAVAISPHGCFIDCRHYNWVNLCNPTSNRLISLGINWRWPWIEWKTIWNNSSSSTNDQKIISIMISIWSNATLLKSNERSKSKFVMNERFSTFHLFFSSPNTSIRSHASIVCTRNKSSSIKSWIIVEPCHFPTNKFNRLWTGIEEQWTCELRMLDVSQNGWIARAHRSSSSGIEVSWTGGEDLLSDYTTRSRDDIGE